MKRKWLWVWAGVMFPPFVCLYPHRPVAEDRAVLGPSEFVFPCRTAAPAASTPPAWSRAGPRKSFALHSEFLTTHDVGPLWLDHRGSPRPPGSLHLLLTSCNAAQAGGQRRDRADVRKLHFSNPSNLPTIPVRLPLSLTLEYSASHGGGVWFRPFR